MLTKTFLSNSHLSNQLWCTSLSCCQYHLAIEENRRFDVDYALEVTKKVVTDYADITQFSQSLSLFEYDIQQINDDKRSSTFEFNFGFMQFLLDLGLQLQCDAEHRTVLSLRITDFIAGTRRAVLFRLFQAGAEPAFIFRCKNIKTPNPMHDSKHDSVTTKLCKVLVLECNREITSNVYIDFENNVIGNMNDIAKYSKVSMYPIYLILTKFNKHTDSYSDKRNDYIILFHMKLDL